MLLHSHLWNPDLRIRENFARGIQNPGIWNLEYSSRKDWNFYHLSWKTVFNFKQNAVSHNFSIIVNVIANQTR